MYGALILGDAAVTANIVSPILVIVVAITGITAFAFVFVLHLAMLSSINSFGVSYLSPFTPAANSEGYDYFLPPAWKRENRRTFLNTKRQKRQDEISRKWKKGAK